MKNRLLLQILLTGFLLDCAAQTSVIWSEDFDGNGGAGTNWNTTALNTAIGVQGANANLWYISDQEDGNAVGACGTGGNGDNSLHLGSSTLGDIGAAYDAGCMPGCATCDFSAAFCSNTTTDKRSNSQTINTTGFTNITLSFNYIENGEGATDNAVMEYSTNSGTSWTTLADPAKTPTACAPQGQWTAFSMTLPVAAENINTLQLGFRWANDANSSGSDPSFAVDDINLTVPLISLPTELYDLSVAASTNGHEINWTTVSESDVAYFEVQRSVNGALWTTLQHQAAMGTLHQTQRYSITTAYPPIGNSYYRLKIVDANGSYGYSSVVSATFWRPLELTLYPNPGDHCVYVPLPYDPQTQIRIYNSAGQLQDIPIKNRDGSYQLFTAELPDGLYYVVIQTGSECTQKLLQITH